MADSLSDKDVAENFEENTGNKRGAFFYLKKVTFGVVFLITLGFLVLSVLANFIQADHAGNLNNQNRELSAANKELTRHNQQLVSDKNDLARKNQLLTAEVKELKAHQNTNAGATTSSKTAGEIIAEKALEEGVVRTFNFLFGE